MRATWSLLAIAGCSSCSGPSGTPDAPPADAGKCGAEAAVYGELVDWDSSSASFHGVPFVKFQIEGDADPAHTDTTPPNGRIEMCAPPSGRALIKLTPGNVDVHVAGHFIADPAFFAGGRTFSLRIFTAARAASFFSEHGLTYDAAKADLLVQEAGTPAALTLTGATAEATLASADGITWAPGASGKYVLFANVTVTGAPAIAGPSIGSGPVPMIAGELTMTSVASP
jgi:hypothetical protein